MLLRKSTLVLAALTVFGLGFVFLRWNQDGPCGFRLTLNTPCGDAGFAEHDWNRVYRDFDSTRFTIDGYRERIRERFLIQKLQPKARYTTIVFLGSHSCRIDRPVSYVVAVGFGAACLLTLIVLAALKSVGRQA